MSNKHDRIFKQNRRDCQNLDRKDEIQFETSNQVKESENINCSYKTSYLELKVTRNEVEERNDDV